MGFVAALCERQVGEHNSNNWGIWGLHLELMEITNQLITRGVPPCSYVKSQFLIGQSSCLSSMNGPWSIAMLNIRKEIDCLVISQMLHVWHIYLHLHQKWLKCRYTYSSTMEHLGMAVGIHIRHSMGSPVGATNTAEFPNHLWIDSDGIPSNNQTWQLEIHSKFGVSKATSGIFRMNQKSTTDMISQDTVDMATLSENGGRA